MRGSRAKKLRKYAKIDSADLPTEVVYTTALQSSKTRVLGECQRQYYQLLKRIWKAAK